MITRLRSFLPWLASLFLAGHALAAVSVESRVWEDLNKDGRQDPGEPGLQGATVQMWNPDFTVVAGSAVTNSSGNCQMTVPSGAQYRMRVILPFPGDRFTLSNVGADAADSDILPSSTHIGNSDIYTFAPALTVASTLDAGAISDPMRDHNIGDKVFRAPIDGTQNESAPGRSNTTVQLLNPAGAVLQSMVTDATGFYSFKAPPGTYRLRFTHPVEIPTAWKDAGSDDTLDSDIDADGYTDLFTIAAGEVRRDIDAGFVYPVQLGDFVWDDIDGDGVQDPGEPGLAGVALELWDSGFVRRFHTTTSDENGAYNFVAPGAGGYRIRAILAYPGDQFSPKDTGANNQKDSDVNPGGPNAGLTDVIDIPVNVISNVTFDIGISPDPMKDHTIGDRVFRAQLYGLQGGLSWEGVNVRLLNEAGMVLQTTVSGSRGFYSFKAPPGTYRLHFYREGFIPSRWKDYGSDDTIDNDIDENGYTDLFTLLPGQVIRSMDAGFVEKVYLGNFVWSDVNANGVQDDGEPGIPGVALELWNAEKTPRYGATVSGSDGAYNLFAPGPGDYRIFALRPLPADTFSPPLSPFATVLTDSNIIDAGSNFGFTDIITIENNVISISALDVGITLATGPRIITPFRVTGITPGATSTSLVFTGPSGGTYRIERSPDLVTWTEAVAPFVSSSATVTRSVAVPAGFRQQHFFRVRRTR
ncbi:MAG: hypothetical protein EOP88_17755 [Verrucomicrobiaceae bacterium]|nr:MAG: hypothetical protein EOP88_17755 [Verrucomicrobiaceae bacterium]